MTKRANLLLLIGLFWICCVCSAGYLSLFRPGIGTRWRQEPASPEPLSRLAMGAAGEITGYAPDGTMYEFNYGIYGNASSWQKVTQPSGVAAIGEGCVPDNSHRIVVPPPGKVKSRVNESCVHVESEYHLEVALLENGEVWSWENESYAYAELFIMALLFIGLVVGVLILLIGIGSMIYKKFKKTA